MPRRKDIFENDYRWGTDFDAEHVKRGLEEDLEAERAKKQGRGRKPPSTRRYR